MPGHESYKNYHSISSATAHTVVADVTYTSTGTMYATFVSGTAAPVSAAASNDNCARSGGSDERLRRGARMQSSWQSSLHLPTHTLHLPTHMLSLSTTRHPLRVLRLARCLADSLSFFSVSVAVCRSLSLRGLSLMTPPLSELHVHTHTHPNSWPPVHNTHLHGCVNFGERRGLNFQRHVVSNRSRIQGNSLLPGGPVRHEICR